MALPERTIMQQVTLIGIDPGVNDTGIVALRLDSERLQWSIKHKVWSNVVTLKDRVVTVDPSYLEELQEFVNFEKSFSDPVLVGVEGYRQRGYNIRQDQKMLVLVKETHSAIKGSTIIDNTGIKNVVTEPLMQLFKVNKFPATYHADLKSAARVALKLGIMDDTVNTLLSDFVRDNLGGVSWALDSTSITQ